MNEHVNTKDKIAPTRNGGHPDRCDRAVLSPTSGATWWPTSPGTSAARHFVVMVTGLSHVCLVGSLDAMRIW
jgi:hypothetical protein